MEKMFSDLAKESVLPNAVCTSPSPHPGPHALMLMQCSLFFLLLPEGTRTLQSENAQTNNSNKGLLLLRSLLPQH